MIADDDFATPDVDGFIPIASASSKGYAEVEKLLVAAEAHAATPNKSGMTSVNLVTSYGHADMVGC